MNRAKLLALSILAATNLWGTAAATQAASPVRETEPQPQAGNAQTDSSPLLQDDESGDQSGIDEGNDDNETGSATERDQNEHGEVEDDDRGDQDDDENDVDDD
jgi:hypothetical protein